MNESRGLIRPYAIVLVATGTYTGLMFIWFSLPAYLPTIIAEVGLSGTQAGLLAGAVPLMYIPLGLVMGLAVDRVGATQSLTAAMVLIGVGQIGRSVSADFVSLLACTMLIGVGATLITFGLPKLVGTLFPPDRLGLPTAIYLVGAAGGSATAFALGRPLFGPLLGGWRELFLVSGIVAVAYAIVWLLTSRLARTGQIAREDDGPRTLSAVRRDLRIVLTHRDLQLVVIVAMMYLCITHGLQGWLPTILESRGLAPARAGPATSLYVAASVVGIIAVPTLADRYAGRRPSLVVCGAIGFVGLAGLLFGGIGPLVIAGICTVGFAVGGISPLVRAIPPDLDDVGARLTGTAMGFAFAIGELGGFGGPFLIGAFYDLTGTYVSGLALLLASTLVVVAASLAMADV